MMGGRCVQLVSGDPKTAKDFGDPVEKAIEYRDMGIEALHIIDLDATLGLGDNLETALKVAKTFKKQVEFGGGIRTIEKANTVLETLTEKDRIICGTLAIADHPKYEKLKSLEKFKNRIIASVDSKEGYVAVNGWRKKSEYTAKSIMTTMSEHVWGFLYTDIDVEGKMKGINQKTIEEIVASSEKPVIISGGITTKEDVRECEKAGAWGVVLGKAIYEGKLKLEDIL